MSAGVIGMLGWLLAALCVGVIWKIKPSWRPVTGPLFGALTAGLAVYLFGKRAMFGRPEEIDQAEPANTPPEYLDEMADSIPDDHPDVTPERRERAEQGASVAVEFDDASRAERERIDAELDAELRELLDD